MIEEGREGNRNPTKRVKYHTQVLSSSVKCKRKQRNRTGGLETVWAASELSLASAEFSTPSPSSSSVRTAAASKEA